jgi:tRNA G10  N-methylase Trm11
MLSCAELVSLSQNAENSQDNLEFLTLTPSGALIRTKDLYPDITRSGTLLKSCTPRLILQKPISYDKIVQACATIVQTQFLDDKPHWCVSAYEERDPEEIDEHGNADEDYYEMVVSGFREVLKSMGVRKHTYIPAEQNQDQLRVYNPERSFHAIMPKKMMQKKILEGGFECVLFHHGNEIIWCTTDAVLDIIELEDRDVKRPFFRAKLGMGAALARAMIHISQRKPPGGIYDPFCGTGIILQEALLLGYTPQGSDVDETCIIGTIENISWISQRMKVKKPKNIVKKIDFTRASDHLHDIETIVTEPYLGPALTRYPDKRAASKIIRDLSERYQRYMASIRDVLSDDGVAVIIVPGIRTAEEMLYTLDPDDLFTRYGFSIIKQKIQNVDVPFVFLHAPKEQRVERLIYVISRV